MTAKELMAMTEEQLIDLMRDQSGLIGEAVKAAFQLKLVQRIEKALKPLKVDAGAPIRPNSGFVDR